MRDEGLFTCTFRGSPAASVGLGNTAGLRKAILNRPFAVTRPAAAARQP